MLPILVFESAWKVAWLTAVALPLWAHHQLDPDTRTVAGAVLWVVLVLAITPWRYVFTQYVRSPGDRWRSSPTRAPSTSSRRSAATIVEAAEHS